MDYTPAGASSVTIQPAVLREKWVGQRISGPGRIETLFPCPTEETKTNLHVGEKSFSILYARSTM